MANIFAGSEVIELGIQIEKNGKDFYQILAQNSKSNDAKKVFEFLAGEEEKHIIVFQKLLDKVQKYEPPQIYSQEYFEYMNLLASEYVFTQKDKGQDAARSVNNDKEAVDLGIKFEKDSILFYEGMKKLVMEYDRKAIDELILQEQSHLRQLAGLKGKL